MRLRDILNRTTGILPYLTFFIGIQHYISGIDERAFRLQRINNLTRHLLTEIQNNEDVIISNQVVQDKISSLSTNAIMHLDLVKIYNENIDRLVIRLNDPNITNIERESILRSIAENTDDKIGILNTTNSTLQRIIDEVSSNGISESSSFLGDLFYFIKDFMSSLTIEQLLPIINLLGLIVITSFLISIAVNFYGDYLIKYFKIEEKYPRIAKYIQLRRKFQFYLFNLDFLLIIPIIPLLFWFNLSYFIHISN